MGPSSDSSHARALPSQRGAGDDGPRPSFASSSDTTVCDDSDDDDNSDDDGEKEQSEVMVLNESTQIKKVQPARV